MGEPIGYFYEECSGKQVKLYKEDRSNNPIEDIYKNMQCLKSANPFHLAIIKKELKKFSAKSLSWKEEK
jgi:hypothetical protein